MTSPYFYAIVLIVVLWVLILPMRNGNFSLFLFASISFTSSYPTYEEWKRFILASVRQEKYCSYPTYEEWKLETATVSYNFWSVLILPMRNGNKSLATSFLLWTFRSYPTYEEWKPKVQAITNCILLCSYPTYEEWKLINNVNFFTCFCVLILPMRNGNPKFAW